MMKNQTSKGKPAGFRKSFALQADRRAKLAGEHLRNSKDDELVVIRDPYNQGLLPLGY